MSQYTGPERIKNDRPWFWRVEALTGATDTWTVADSGTLFTLSRAAGIAITLPSLASADDLGVHFKALVITTFTGDLTVTADTGDLLYGTIAMVDSDTGNATTVYSPDASDDLIITCNGTTTGGLVHSWLELIGFKTTGWFVNGISRHSGDVATPFS